MRSVAALAVLLALVPAPALAQSYQCRIPEGPVSVPEPRQDGRTSEIPVTGYTLALSWSPEFCRFRADSARHARQCSGRDGRFGFIVHGLWPEGQGASWPQWCETRAALTAEAIRQNMCLTPDTALLAHEWTKHGACMVNRPETYFRVTRILWNSLRWPDFDRVSRRDGLTAGDVRTAFAEANPHWEVEMIGLKLNERGWLEEMRLCYARDFKPEPCDARRFGPTNDEPVSIWRGL